jgi:hypothetical protein
VTGQNEGYSNLQNSIQDYIFDYLRDKFLNLINIPTKIIIIIDTVMNLSGWGIIQMILKKYGFGYLINYIFYLSILI